VERGHQRGDRATVATSVGMRFPHEPAKDAARLGQGRILGDAEDRPRAPSRCVHVTSLCRPPAPPAGAVPSAPFTIGAGGPTLEANRGPSTAPSIQGGLVTVQSRTDDGG